MRTKPYCKAPWVGLSYTGTEGCQPCCEWKGDRFYGSHTEYLKSDYLKDFKEMVHEDEINPGCIECVEKEKIDTRFGSRRQRFEKYDIDGGYVRLDFRAGDKCNMKCRMCGTGSSSLWRDEDLEQGQTMFGDTVEALKNKSIALKNVYENKYIDTSDVYDIDFSNLSKIMILGGEPSIDLKVRKFLDSVKDLDCHIGVTTNASNASDKWFNTLKQLKKLELDLSIDATGDVQDYQRTGSDWSVLKKNIIKYKETFRNVSINITATAMNFTVLDTWWDEMINLDIQIFMSKCHYPDSMTLDAIPNVYKEYQVAWLKHWIKKESTREDIDTIYQVDAKDKNIAAANHAIGILENSGYIPEMHLKFIEKINYLDGIRDTNIRDLHEIFEDIMDEG
jgi:organic radical activating enzyme